MANPIRTGLKNLHCINTVFCGDQIEAIWANAVRDLGQSSFERGDTVVSLRCMSEGSIKIPIIGFCWNMIQSQDNDPRRQVEWKFSAAAIRFQPAFPYYHNCRDLYQYVKGTDPAAPNYGVPIIVDGITGYPHKLCDFENAGYSKGQVIARVRRGQRYSNFNTGDIVTLSSDIKVYEFKDDSSFGSLAYRQHIQCWYCQENPSGSMFPPIKTLIFDDSDCILQTDTLIVKEFNIPLVSIPGETTMDWIVFSMWNDVPFYGYLSGISLPAYFVMNTDYDGLETSTGDGLHSFQLKLFKTC